MLFDDHSHCSALHPVRVFFFFNDTATTEIYTLSLHDALPISGGLVIGDEMQRVHDARQFLAGDGERSEEHTSELQSHVNLVCRLLLEKKKKKTDLDMRADVEPELVTLRRLDDCARDALVSVMP